MPTPRFCAPSRNVAIKSVGMGVLLGACNIARSTFGPNSAHGHLTWEVRYALCTNASADKSARGTEIAFCVTVASPREAAKVYVVFSAGKVSSVKVSPRGERAHQDRDWLGNRRRFGRWQFHAENLCSG